MKKYLIVIIAIFLAVLFGACSAASGSDVPAASAAGQPQASGTAAQAEPSDTPTSSVSAEMEQASAVESVFGKAVKIAVLSNGSAADSALFFAGAQSEAASLGIEIATEASETGFDSSVEKYAGEGVGAIVAYLPKAPASYNALKAAADKGIPVSVFELQKGAVPEKISHTYYNSAKEAATALDAAIAYPPHDTPVRQISLFESKKTPAYTAYKTYLDQGKIFPKELYIAAGNKTAPTAWLTSKLKGYYAGMLDAIFADSEKLVLSAMDALEAKKRDDMTVFCTGITEAIAARMKANPEVFVQAVGPNVYFAGVLNLRIAAGMIKGSSPATEEFAPCTLNASDLIASDENTVFTKLAGDLASKYNESWMNSLRSATSK